MTTHSPLHSTLNAQNAYRNAAEPSPRCVSNTGSASLAQLRSPSYKLDPAPKAAAREVPDAGAEPGPEVGTAGPAPVTLRKSKWKPTVGSITGKVRPKCGIARGTALHADKLNPALSPGAMRRTPIRARKSCQATSQDDERLQSCGTRGSCLQGQAAPAERMKRSIGRVSLRGPQPQRRSGRIRGPR